MGGGLPSRVAAVAVTRWTTWACVTVLDKQGNVVKKGCGGDWGPDLPARCKCGGELRVIAQDVTAVSL